MNISLIGWSHLGPPIVKNLRQPWHLQNANENLPFPHFELQFCILLLAAKAKLSWSLSLQLKWNRICTENTLQKLTMLNAQVQVNNFEESENDQVGRERPARFFYSHGWWGHKCRTLSSKISSEWRQHRVISYWCTIYNVYTIYSVFTVCTQFMLLYTSYTLACLFTYVVTS